MATGTLGSSARHYHTRQTHYLSANLTSGTGGNWLAQQSVKLGTIPAGASIARITQYTSQVNNAATSTAVSVGTAASGTTVVAITNGGMATLGVTALTVAASSATVILAADTDIYVTNNCSGTVATTGIHQFSVEY